MSEQAYLDLFPGCCNCDILYHHPNITTVFRCHRCGHGGATRGNSFEQKKAKCSNIKCQARFFHNPRKPHKPYDCHKRTEMMIGKRYGPLTVIELVRKKAPNEPGKKRTWKDDKNIYKIKCDCGREFVKSVVYLYKYRRRPDLGCDTTCPLRTAPKSGGTAHTIFRKDQYNLWWPLLPLYDNETISSMFNVSIEVVKEAREKNLHKIRH